MVESDFARQYLQNKRPLRDDALLQYPCTASNCRIFGQVVGLDLPFFQLENYLGQLSLGNVIA
jgi:hypothetical protein